MPDFNSTALIVVGIDGSESSKDALRWAATQAKQTGAQLHAVAAWQLPSGYGWAPDLSGADFAAEAQKELDQTVAQVLGGDHGVSVVARVAEGHAATVLIEASRGADLLVVGSRGHGAFTGMLLGSVSQHCAQHAACPVVIVRHTARGDRL